MERLSNILLVDDDPVVNYLNETILTDLEITNQITVAGNGKEALHLLYEYNRSNEEDLPELILLDLNMPVMDGFDFLEAYQKLDIKNKDSIVIVISTSSLDPTDLKRIDQYHTNGYVVKPLSQEKLAPILEKYFGEGKE